MPCHPVPRATPELLWAAETSDFSHRIPADDGEDASDRTVRAVRSRSSAHVAGARDVAFTFMLMQTVLSADGSSL